MGRYGSIVYWMLYDPMGRVLLYDPTVRALDVVWYDLGIRVPLLIFHKIGDIT